MSDTLVPQKLSSSSIFRKVLKAVEICAAQKVDPMLDPEERAKREARYLQSAEKDMSGIDWGTANEYDQHVKDFLLKKPGALSIKEARERFHHNNRGRDIYAGYGPPKIEKKDVDKQIGREDWMERARIEDRSRYK